jgi:hypothetical protein
MKIFAVYIYFEQNDRLSCKFSINKTILYATRKFNDDSWL